MGAFFAASVPGLVMLLFVLAAAERVVRHIGRSRAGAATGSPLGGVGFDEITALFYASKRDELTNREAHSLIRHESPESLPERMSGLIVIRVPKRKSSTARPAR